MNFLTRRLLTVCTTGALAVAVFSGCGIINSAVDCATVGETMTEITGKVGGDSKALKKSTDKLRDQAKDIEDEKLKKSAEDFADEAENLNSGANGDVGGAADTNAGKLKDASKDFMDQCNAL
ncbi:MAG: hypothetical protein ACRD0P_00675 [Stackebrandtia sp.]